METRALVHLGSPSNPPPSSQLRKASLRSPANNTGGLLAASCGRWVSNDSSPSPSADCRQRSFSPQVSQPSSPSSDSPSPKYLPSATLSSSLVKCGASFLDPRLHLAGRRERRALKDDHDFSQCMFGDSSREQDRLRHELAVAPNRQ